MPCIGCGRSLQLTEDEYTCHRQDISTSQLNQEDVHYALRELHWILFYICEPCGMNGDPYSKVFNDYLTKYRVLQALHGVR